MTNVSAILREKLNESLKLCWTKSAELRETDPESADKFKERAFELLEQLPENQIYLQVRQ